MGLEQNRDAGIYCRLSVDDGTNADSTNPHGESVSIENQKLLLRKYVKEQGWNEVDVYIDDGYSGTNFDRPAVKRLIEDAKAGLINIIVVKDLSRFGRNYIEIGQYTDYLFPTIGCRFVALGNGVDTVSQSSNNDMMGFLNLFNEFYARDTSKKVRAVRKACAENGKFMGTYAPIGYRKDPQDKHRLIVDEETALLAAVFFHGLDGAVARVPCQATAYFSKAWSNMSLWTTWDTPEGAAPGIHWVEDFRKAMIPFTQGVYVNTPDLSINN
ncbi:MAG: hypothetical protein A2Y17_05065 [Clostridiales bacterium GWF2_38_85]|nr:MAG: hypothetical protein A2Y17_05065 [Clostridiales bacterium GWF2_38_85]HBL84342.1 hypothetical protein [Clostridiales bacterium]